MALVSIPNYLAASVIVIAAFWKLAAKLIEFERPQGRHAAPHGFEPTKGYDEQTIQVFRTMNQPPPEFFADGPYAEPEWADEMRTWQFDSSSIAALRKMLYLKDKIDTTLAEYFTDDQMAA